MVCCAHLYIISFKVLILSCQKCEGGRIHAVSSFCWSIAYLWWNIITMFGAPFNSNCCKIIKIYLCAFILKNIIYTDNLSMEWRIPLFQWWSVCTWRDDLLTQANYLHFHLSTLYINVIYYSMYNNNSYTFIIFQIEFIWQQNMTYRFIISTV